jgi:hypothetical protein
MNCFILIKTVLDEAYAQIPGTEDEKDKAIKAALSELSREYANLRSKGCLDYSDPVRRFAYIFKYTTCHANYVCTVLAGSTVMPLIFKKDRLTVSTIGGGPGSDFLGILKFCQARGIKTDIKCLLVDRDPAWGESWMDVDTKIAPANKMSAVFQPFDVTDPDSYKTFQKHFKSDIFTLVYFMSEVFALRKKATVYFEALFASMPKGAAVLFIDNNHSDFINWFDGLAAKHNILIKEKFEGTMKLPIAEEKKDLKQYYDKFGSPKIQADLAYRIGVKE